MIDRLLSKIPDRYLNSIPNSIFKDLPRNLQRQINGAGRTSESEKIRRKVYGEPWEFEHLDEHPYTHYTEAIEKIKQLKRERRHDEVEDLLLWCINFSEAEARAENTIPIRPAPAYYRHLGIVYRKDNRYDHEVALLERYLAVCEELQVNPDEDLVDRLDRARELAS